MRKSLLLIVIAPALAFSQGVARPAFPPELIFVARYINAVAAAGNVFGEVVIGARPFTIRRVTTRVSSAGGGGAGTTVFRATDGTNVCDCTMTCAASQSTGGKDVACSGACTFTPGASVATSIATAGCTTTQPTIQNVDFRGFER